MTTANQSVIIGTNAGSNITTGNALEKIIGDNEDKKDNNKENLMDDHITKVGASETIYLPDGKVSKLVSTKLPNYFDSVYRSGSLTYNNLLVEWNLPVFKVTNKIKPYFIHNQKLIFIKFSLIFAC